MSAFGTKRTLELLARTLHNSPEIVIHDRDLRTGLWIWDATGVRGFVTLLARV
jgi:hypothetical protein